MTDTGPEQRVERTAELVGALTDVALAFETALLALTVASGPARRHRSARPWFVLLFAGAASASAAGAIHHGLPPGAGRGRRRTWRATTTALAAASLAAWQVAIQLALAPRLRRPASALATTAHLAELAVLDDSAPYRLVLSAQVPGLAALGAAFAARLGDQADRGPALGGLVGVGLTAAAAGVQVGRIRIHRRWFDHNATYHVVQGLAFAALGASARGLLDSGPDAIVRAQGGRA